jgi:putative methionine-R-sulfoxide reductase with GAF domain
MSENQDIHVWLAPLPETHVVVPIHIDIGTAAGELDIDASEFTLGQKIR